MNHTLLTCLRFISKYTYACKFNMYAIIDVFIMLIGHRELKFKTSHNVIYSCETSFQDKLRKR